MFSSSQHLAFRHQVINLIRAYPCPRCPTGVIESSQAGEIFDCDHCHRKFVALNGGRFLYPARYSGWRFAPTFWWDGMSWHMAGTTAGTAQLLIVGMLTMMPMIALNVALCAGIWSSRPDWCHPLLLNAVTVVMSLQLAYLLCWNFDFST